MRRVVLGVIGLSWVVSFDYWVYMDHQFSDFTNSCGLTDVRVSSSSRDTVSNSATFGWAKVLTTILFSSLPNIKGSLEVVWSFQDGMIVCVRLFSCVVCAVFKWIGHRITSTESVYRMFNCCCRSITEWSDWRRLGTYATSCRNLPIEAMCGFQFRLALTLLMQLPASSIGLGTSAKYKSPHRVKTLVVSEKIVVVLPRRMITE